MMKDVLAEHVETFPQHHTLSWLNISEAHCALKGLFVLNDIFEVCSLEGQEVLLPLFLTMPSLLLNVLYVHMHGETLTC